MDKPIWDAQQKGLILEGSQIVITPTNLIHKITKFPVTIQVCYFGKVFLEIGI